MERNIKSEIDSFLDELKLGVILKSSDKIRHTLSKKMPSITDINKIKEAMEIHKLAYEILKQENSSISQEMGMINQSTKFNKIIMPNKHNAIYIARA